jgi:hypothetical protein
MTTTQPFYPETVIRHKSIQADEEIQIGTCVAILLVFGGHDFAFGAVIFIITRFDSDTSVASKHARSDTLFRCCRFTGGGCFGRRNGFLIGFVVVIILLLLTTFRTVIIIIVVVGLHQRQT